MFECEFCKKTFSTKSNMSLHKKTTKRCLKIQNELNSKTEVKKYECKYCCKEFLLKQTVEEHERICKNRDTFNHKQILKEYELLKIANSKLTTDFMTCSRSLEETKDKLKETKDKLKETKDELNTAREKLSAFKDEELKRIRRDYKELIDIVSKNVTTVDNYDIELIGSL